MGRANQSLAKLHILKAEAAALQMTKEARKKRKMFSQNPEYDDDDDDRDYDMITVHHEAYNHPYQIENIPNTIITNLDHFLLASHKLYDGANSAFQESVGDAIMYAVMSPQHLQRLGLINDSVFSPEKKDLVLSSVISLCRTKPYRLAQLAPKISYRGYKGYYFNHRDKRIRIAITDWRGGENHCQYSMATGPFVERSSFFNDPNCVGVSQLYMVDTLQLDQDVDTKATETDLAQVTSSNETHLETFHSKGS
uniref:(California timema) hypothetical protein n=1 Tax=Timema californicum TaxID=61474 RepID=A0A7R9JCW0_TIMCA|nr:unnamed protein product [Timema californicum]